jgi:hypothetical protein
MEWLITIAVLLAVVWFVASKRIRRQGRNTDGPGAPLVYVGNIPDRERTQPLSDLPERDAWETGALAGAEGEIPVKVEAEIRYIDGEGQRSTRRVTTRSLVPWNGEFAILAYCHARKAHRTFLISRLQEFIDLTSGEIVPNVVEHLKAIYYVSPEGRIAGVLDRQSAEIDILLFVARANGHLSPKERNLLIGYLKKTNREISAPDEAWTAAIPAGAPAIREFRSAVRVAVTIEAERLELLITTIEAISALVANELTKAAAMTAIRELQSRKSA